MGNGMKVVGISAQSAGRFEESVATGLQNAARPAGNIQGAWVNQMKVVTTPEGKGTHRRVHARAGLVVD